MSPDKTLRSGRRRSKSEKPKAAPESPQNPREANCDQHAPGCSVSRISGKIRSFGWACSELKKFPCCVDGQIVSSLILTIEEELYDIVYVVSEDVRLLKLLMHMDTIAKKIDLKLTENIVMPQGIPKVRLFIAFCLRRLGVRLPIFIDPN